MAPLEPLKLSAQLVGHDADVRAVSFPRSDLVLTASRDKTVRTWRRAASSSTFEPHIARQAAAYVNAIAFLPASSAYPEGLVASGDLDGLLEIAAPDALPTDNAERLLIGHSRNVCTVDVSPNGKWIVSGGWDGQARVWSTEKWETEIILDNDGSGVWAVLALDDKTVVTGGIDKKIRIFDLRTQIAGECQPNSVIYTSDVIRSLCAVPKSHPSGAAIASATNDFIIRLWAMNGREVGTLEGHQSYVYSIDAIPQTGEMVSVGEDRTLRVWKGNECVQTITHPAISVWSVAVCKDTGDVVTGTSDGVSRVWTRDSSRVAESRLQQQFEASVQASAIPQQQVGNVNKEALPGPEFLEKKSGTKEGQVQMIKQPDGSVTAHQWSLNEGWINIGNVVDSVGSSTQKVQYLGQEYDYVFDVDIEDGKPPLKLPYNVSANPYDAATKFLNDNELPISYLESVAKFIVENTKGATIGTTPATPDAQPKAADLPKGKILPQQEYISLLAAKYEAIIKKILTVNATLISTGRKDYALNPAEQDILKGLQQSLEAAPVGPIDQDALSIVIRIVTQWPQTDKLAGLDLLRCMVPSARVARYSHPSHGSIVKIAVKAGLAGDSEGMIIENCAMMAVRVVANLFTTEQGRKAIAASMRDILRLLSRILGLDADATPVGKTNRNVLMAVTTALINLAVLARRTTALNMAQKEQVKRMTGEILKGQTDAEVLYRALVALGTLMAAGARSETTPAEAVALRLWVNGALGRASGEKRVKDVATECLGLL